MIELAAILLLICIGLLSMDADNQTKPRSDQARQAGEPSPGNNSTFYSKGSGRW